jgi:prophage regulatory protein
MPKLVKIKDLIQTLNISRATIYRLLKEDKFPKPLKIGNGTFWRENDINEWLLSIS